MNTILFPIVDERTEKVFQIRKSILEKITNLNNATNKSDSDIVEAAITLFNNPTKELVTEWQKTYKELFPDFNINHRTVKITRPRKNKNEAEQE